MTLKNDVLDGLRQLSQDDLKSVLAAGVSLVQNPERGIGTTLFEALFKLVPQPCVEVLPVDNINRPSRVLFERRPSNAVTDPGRTSALGTYIRMGETDIDAINRCINRELGPKFNVSTARFSHHYNNPEGCSGEKPAIGRQRHTVGLVYLVQLDDTIPETIDRKWTSAIPPDLLSGHRIMAAKALGFQSTSKSLFS